MLAIFLRLRRGQRRAVNNVVVTADIGICVVDILICAFRDVMFNVLEIKHAETSRGKLT